MGLFNFSGGGNMGYANVKNTQNFTNEDLLEKLSKVKVSFGTPIMGDIKGTQSVMYKNVTDKFDVFVRTDKDKIIMGKIGADGVNSAKTALSSGLDMFLGHKDEGTSTADRAVDELLEVVKKLLAGETVAESSAAGPAKTSTGAAISLYMKQKAISVKPKFDIFDQDQNVVYHVEGAVTRLSFSIQKDGNEVLKLKKKAVSIMPEYSIAKDGQDIAKIKKKLKLTRPELDGTINGQELKINGDIMGFDFDIQVGGKVIGHIDTDCTVWSDTYRISILDESQQDLVIALAIICDNVVDQSGN
jgi:uncharacterized protein YxjI